jgi:hypothetical protein
MMRRRKGKGDLKVHFLHLLLLLLKILIQKILR